MFVPRLTLTQERKSG